MVLVFENSQHAMERNYGAVAHRRTHVHKETEFNSMTEKVPKVRIAGYFRGSPGCHEIFHTV